MITAYSLLLGLPCSFVLLAVALSLTFHMTQGFAAPVCLVALFALLDDYFVLSPRLHSLQLVTQSSAAPASAAQQLCHCLAATATAAKSSLALFSDSLLTHSLLFSPSSICS